MSLAAVVYVCEDSIGVGNRADGDDSPDDSSEKTPELCGCGMSLLGASSGVVKLEDRVTAKSRDIGIQDDDWKSLICNEEYSVLDHVDLSDSICPGEKSDVVLAGFCVAVTRGDQEELALGEVEEKATSVVDMEGLDIWNSSEAEEGSGLGD